MAREGGVRKVMEEGEGKDRTCVKRGEGKREREEKVMGVDVLHVIHMVCNHIAENK